MSDVTLGDVHSSWIKLAFDRIDGRGRVVHRLCFTLKAQVLKASGWLVVDHLYARLLHGQEILGVGETALRYPMRQRPGVDEQLSLEIVVRSEALAYLDEQVRGDQIDLTLDFSGRLFVHTNPQTSDELPAFPSDPGWIMVPVGQSATTQLHLQVARSDWFTRVLQPFGRDRFILTEIRIPVGGVGKQFTAAEKRLSDAERAYSIGDDPATFSYCRAALDALPGAKQEIFKNVVDPGKRQDLDSLAKSLGSYLHRGRHVAGEGSQQGEFPIDHRDAGFALSMTKLLVAFVSQVT